MKKFFGTSGPCLLPRFGLYLLAVLSGGVRPKGRPARLGGSSAARLRRDPGRRARLETDQRIQRAYPISLIMDTTNCKHFYTLKLQALVH